MIIALSLFKFNNELNDKKILNIYFFRDLNPWENLINNHYHIINIMLLLILIKDEFVSFIIMFINKFLIIIL